MNEIEDSSFLSRPSSTRPSQGASSPVGSERSSRLSAQFNLSNQSSSNNQLQQQQQQSQSQINTNPFGSRSGNRSTSGSLSLTESTPSLHDNSESRTDSSFHSHSPSSNGNEDRNSDPAIAAAIERKRQEHERHRALQRQAFEQEMLLLEKKQREEEDRLRSSGAQDSISQTNRNPNNAARSQLLAVSAPTTPPEPKLSIQRPGNSSSSPILGTLENPLHSDTQDGLNGSNVPGLRSLPTSRRASRDSKDPIYGEYTSAIGGGSSSAILPNSAGVQPSQPQRRPIGSDLSSSFERLDLVPRGVSQLRAQSQDNSLSSISSSRGSANSSSGQASPLHRSISRSGSDQNGNGSNETCLTPVLSERFLFDDELDAEDSAFIKRYNLQDKPDDKFPVLIRRDSFPKSNDPRLGAESSKEQSQRSHYQAPGSNLNDLPAPPNPDRRPNTDSLRPGEDAGFPSFAMNAFNNNGLASPNHFAPYSPSAFDGGNAPSRSRPNSGYFDAFGSSQSFGNGGAGAGFGIGSSSDPSGLGEPTTPAGIKSASLRKGELDVATRLEELQGEIFPLCKDQHGCRYLQKKLEENTPHYRDMIFAETFDHFSELMTDPFGNYLCQKMLEFCTDEQRNHIVDSVRNDLVTISLNMHGTRAVQKTIDFLSTPRQIQSIIFALGASVVTLIKDLNGNHVIQKCLNRLGAEDNQFIYNAVAQNCVEVATHRHGCCVLQRCIDHASESQRNQLVAEITYNALTLVQDPFGNYVVQYVLDLNDARYSDGVIRQFIGNVCLLSVQKFSSNVIEKCIRVSEPGTRKLLIDELLNRTRLEKLLRDSFANYVVQTSLDYAEPLQRIQLVECIRPILPVIRNTPYGKRIQSKLQRDNIDLGPPPNMNMSYSLLQAAHQQQLQAMAVMAARGAPVGDFGAAGMGMGMGVGVNPYNANLGAGMMGGPVPPLPQQAAAFPPMHHQQHQTPQLPPSQRMNPNNPMYNTAQALLHQQQQQQQQPQQFGAGPPPPRIGGGGGGGPGSRGAYHGQNQPYGGQGYGVNGFSAGMPSPMLQGGGYAGGRY